MTKAEVRSCTYGDPSSETKVAVVGDSKVLQWVPALQLLAEQNDWLLTVLTKSSCSFSTAITPAKEGGPSDTCTSWNKDVLQRLVTVEKPDYLLTSQGSPQAILPNGDLSTEAMVNGMRESWSAVAAVGTEVIVIADNPHPGMNVYECVEEHLDDLTQCTYDRGRLDTSGAHATQVIAVKGQDHVKMIDLFDAICPADRCPPVIGNVLIYRQGAHITATYVKTMTPRLAKALSGVGLKAKYASPTQ
jgi:hypothetical protein